MDTTRLRHLETILRADAANPKGGSSIWDTGLLRAIARPAATGTSGGAKSPRSKRHATPRPVRSGLHRSIRRSALRAWTSRFWKFTAAARKP
jgi:hypothetical protein